MISRQAKIQEDTIYQVMRILETNPDLTQRELAEKLGLSVGGLNYCLKALIKKGWVKKQHVGISKNKFGHVYVLTIAGSTEKSKKTANYFVRKVEEFVKLKKEIELLEKDLKPILAEKKEIE
jgi:EPS-associated MarR family transcriptional regulator